jgi:hypothetical protein
MFDLVKACTFEKVGDGDSLPVSTRMGRNKCAGNNDSNFL